VKIKRWNLNVLPLIDNMCEEIRNPVISHLDKSIFDIIKERNDDFEKVALEIQKENYI